MPTASRTAAIRPDRARAARACSRAASGSSSSNSPAATRWRATKSAVDLSSVVSSPRISGASCLASISAGIGGPVGRAPSSRCCGCARRARSGPDLNVPRPPCRAPPRLPLLSSANSYPSTEFHGQRYGVRAASTPIDDPGPSPRTGSRGHGVIRSVNGHLKDALDCRQTRKIGLTTESVLQRRHTQWRRDSHVRIGACRLAGLCP